VIDIMIDFKFVILLTLFVSLDLESSSLDANSIHIKEDNRIFREVIIYDDSCELEIKTKVTSGVLVVSNVGECENLKVNTNLYLDKLPLLLGLAISKEKINKFTSNKSAIEVRFSHKISNWHIIDELNKSESWPLRKEDVLSLNDYKKYLFSEVKKTKFVQSIKESFLRHGCIINLSENFADSNFRKPHFINKSDLIDWEVELSTIKISKNVFPNLKGGIFFDIQSCTKGIKGVGDT
jgi:hypothetical protein